MSISNPDVVNSCRVCRSPNQDGNYQCLFQNKDEGLNLLSEAGTLYENLFRLSIDLNYHYYPQFLCNSCDLQMKLFKKLKDKALKTLEYLKDVYREEIVYETETDIIYQVLEVIDYRNEKGQDALGNTREREEQPAEIITKEGQHEKEHQNEEVMQTFKAEEILEILPSEEKEADSQNQDVLQTFDDEKNLESLTLHHHESRPQIDFIRFENNYEEVEAFENNVDTSSTTDFFQIQLDSQDTCEIEKSDYVTEIYELMDDNSITQYSETSEHLNEVDDFEITKAESSTAYSDIEYVESIYMESENDVKIPELNTPRKRIRNSSKPNNTIIGTTRRREYKCGPCKQEFRTSQEYKKHRTLVHDQKYPCSICSKLLKSEPALFTHMRTHNSPNPFQCELCQKTFNQKVHLQYHMNHHNNVRNFKCDVCDKAFITKTDLNVHKRFHTGHRPYVCDICGKSYIMMEHLKAHALIHTEQVFECEVCQRRFSTHKTLRQHVKTIHAEEPQFKCNICLRPFRRKHHLEYHSRQHQKGIDLLDKPYKLADEHELDNEADCGVSDDMEYVDDPGYVALSDDMLM